MKETQESSHKYLTFSLGTEEYGIPLLKVKEVIAVPEITPVPFVPKHFLGIMNLRGQIISVLDLRSKFGTTGPLAGEGDEGRVIIILNLDPVCLGVMVDTVNKVVSLSDEEVSTPPEMLDSQKGATITGVARKDEKLIILLDIASSIDVADLTHIKKNTEAAS